MSYNTPHKWTAAEDAYLLQTATHLSIADIASILGVTQMVATHRCNQLGIEFRLSVWKQIALDKGEDKYFYPIPCRRGHVDSLRRVNGGTCLACEAIRSNNESGKNSKTHIRISSGTIWCIKRPTTIRCNPMNSTRSIVAYKK